MDCGAPHRPVVRRPAVPRRAGRRPPGTGATDGVLPVAGDGRRAGRRADWRGRPAGLLDARGIPPRHRRGLVAGQARRPRRPGTSDGSAVSRSRSLWSSPSLRWAWPPRRVRHPPPSWSSRWCRPWRRSCVGTCPGTSRCSPASRLLAVPMVHWLDADSARLRGRTFYGAHEIRDQHGFRTLLHGTTIHGAQWTRPNAGASPSATTARSRPSRTCSAPASVKAPTWPWSGWALASSSATHGPARTGPSTRSTRPSRRSPPIRRWFTYWADAPVRPTLVIGDGRLRLREADDGTFDLIVLDAFASDSVPAHLLTCEAVELYRRKLRPGGAVLLNVSNRYVDLAPVLAAVARAVGHSTRGRGFTATRTRWSAPSPPGGSCWTTQRSAVAPTAEWERMVPDPSVQAWTDDHTNIVSVLRPLRRRLDEARLRRSATRPIAIDGLAPESYAVPVSR